MDFLLQEEEILCITAGLMSWLRQLVAGLSTRRLEFDARSFLVGLLVTKVAVGQALRIIHTCVLHFQYFSPIISLPLSLSLPIYLSIYLYIYIYTGCPRRNVPDFGREFLMLKYTDITQNTYVQSLTVTEIMAREIWNFDRCYTLIDYQIHIKTGRNMWLM